MASIASMRGLAIHTTVLLYIIIAATLHKTLAQKCPSGKVTKITTSGTLTSPGYPNNYEGYENCEWTIQAPPGQVVRITFDELDIEKDSTCGYDYLKVYDGTSASVRILSTLCGKDIPYPIYSRGRDMYLKFSTDMRVNFKGFSMQIRFTAPPPRRDLLWHCDFEDITWCGMEQRSCGDQTAYRWLRYTKTTPTWYTGPTSNDIANGGTFAYAEAGRPNIQAIVSGSRARLVTPEISNPSGTTTCIMFKYHMLGVHIGRLMVYQGTCPDNKVKVLLDVSGAQGDGWRYAKIEMRLPNKARLTFEAIRGPGARGDIALDSINIWTGECPSYITDSPIVTGAATSSTQSSSSTASSTVSTPSSSSRASTPSTPSTASSSASTPSSSSTASSTASTPSSSSSASTPSTASTASTPSAVSTASTPSAVSTASTPSSVSTASTPSSDLTASTPSVSTVSSISSSTQAVSTRGPLPSACRPFQTTTLSSPGTLMSPGNMESYPPLLTCTWYIEAPTNKFIKITFKQLDLYGFPCMYDFLALYDADSGEPLGMFCGNIMPTPRVLISKATRMKVEFITDALNTRKGFEIDYDFIAPLPQPVLLWKCNFEGDIWCTGMDHKPPAVPNMGVWELRRGSTPTWSTGPSEAFKGSYYMYFETGTGNGMTTSRMARVATPPIMNGGGTVCIRYGYSMYGVEVNKLEVLVLAPSSSKPQLVKTYQGNQGNSWYQEAFTYDLENGSKIIFMAYRGTGSLGDIAVDLIEVFKGDPCTLDYTELKAKVSNVLA